MLFYWFWFVLYVYYCSCWHCWSPHDSVFNWLPLCALIVADGNFLEPFSWMFYCVFWIVIQMCVFYIVHYMFYHVQRIETLFLRFINVFIIIIIIIIINNKLDCTDVMTVGLFVWCLLLWTTSLNLNCFNHWYFQPKPKRTQSMCNASPVCFR